MRVESGRAEYGLIVAGGVGGLQDLRPTRGMALNERWRPIAPLSIPRIYACSAVLEDEDGQPEMWVMGGYDGDDVRAAVEAYNPRTNEWRSCLSLSQRRMGAVAGVVGGRLIVAGGGAPGVGHLISVEAYSPTGWTPLPRLPHAAEAATACVLNGRLYVMGGRGCNKLQVLEMSDENEFSWSLRAELPSERHDAACVVFDGKLWLMGGYVPYELDAFEAEIAEEFEHYNYASSVDIYDPNLDSWAAGPELPFPLSWCSACVHDGKIRVLGINEADWDGSRHAEFHFVHENDGSRQWWEMASCERQPGMWLKPDHSTCKSVLLG